jgi:hypothetical protein
MAEVGSLTWVAEIQEIAESKREAEEMTEGLEGVAEQARETDAAVEEVGDSTGSLSARFGGLEKSAGFLAGGLSLLGGEILLLLGRFGWVGAAAAKLTGLLRGLYVWVAAGGLTGAISTLVGVGQSFVGWLAAGSAGALAFAVAIGALIGLTVTWILEITGVLDVIGELGVMLRDSLPGWARDAMLAVISVFAGGLAVLGGLIAGFVGSGGDLEVAMETAEEVLGIFGGAWERLFDGVMETAGEFEDDLIAWAEGLGDDVASAVSGAVTGAWNTIVPDSITLPEFAVGGQHIGVDVPYVGHVGADLPAVSVGGQEFDFPQLQTGGMVQEGGGAILHEGEMVLPADVSRDVISAIQQAGSSGGGEQAVVIEQQTIEIGDQQLDVRELDRGALEVLADLIAERQGDELTTLVG